MTAKTTKVVPGLLIATPSADEVAREAASRIAKALREAVRARGRATLALSGGETPRATYTRLAAEADVPWPSIDVLWVDERAVPPDHARSNYRLAKETLLDAAHVPGDHVHRMHGDAKDLTVSATEYEAVLRARTVGQAVGVPILDVVVLGVGDDGHTASLFPGEPEVDLQDELVVAVAAKKDREARLTLTAPVLIAARVMFVLAVGAKKTPALERAWAVSGTRSETPARIARECRGNVVWVIDKSAGGLA
jgi:6-phosphogluconolactonase